MKTILDAISDALHAVLHEHVVTPVAAGMVRSCRNRLTGPTRWSTCAPGPVQYWRQISVAEAGRINYATRSGGAR